MQLREWTIHIYLKLDKHVSTMIIFKIIVVETFYLIYEVFWVSQKQFAGIFKMFSVLLMKFVSPIAVTEVINLRVKNSKA